MRFGRRPGERFVDRALVDEFAQPRQCGGGSLQRREQSHQAPPVRRARIFAQRVAERPVLRGATSGKRGHVGGKEGERILRVGSVLGEMQRHATDRAPLRRVRAQPVRCGAPRLATSLANRRIERAPGRLQRLDVEILEPRHRRRVEQPRRQLAAVGRLERRGRGRGLEPLAVAEVREVATRDLAREIHRRRERRTQRCRAEVQQAMADASTEGFDHGRAVRARRGSEASCWSDGEGRRCGEIHAHRAGAVTPRAGRNASAVQVLMAAPLLA